MAPLEFIKGKEKCPRCFDENKHTLGSTYCDMCDNDGYLKDNRMEKVKSFFIFIKNLFK